MVTTNCIELTGQGDCSVPLSGNTAQELQQNVFTHAQSHHPEIVKNMSSQDQQKIIKKIQEVFNKKSAVGARN